MKLFATFVLVLAVLVPAQAVTTQNWTFTAACDSVPGTICTDPANISATFITQMALNTYVDPSGTGVPFDAIEPEIMSLTGTYDGLTMTLTTGNAWLDITVGLSPGFPQMLDFTAGGNEYILYWDGEPFISLGASTEELNFTAVDPIPSVPEPSTLLLFTVPLLLALMRWAQMSLRKYSAH